MKCQYCEGRGFHYVPARRAVAYGLMTAEEAAKPLVPLSLKLQCHVCRGSGHSAGEKS